MVSSRGKDGSNTVSKPQTEMSASPSSFGMRRCHRHLLVAWRVFLLVALPFSFDWRAGEDGLIIISC